jgi:hypothetical protein
MLSFLISTWVINIISDLPAGFNHKYGHELL